MKEKDNYTKYVYKYIHGDLFKCGERSFHADFPALATAFKIFDLYHIDLIWHGFPTKIWKDKHGNIIVRMFRRNIQTLINFY